MKTEKEIRERIKELEDLLIDPDTGEYDEYSYLDEGQQGEMYALAWVLNDESD
jgi:hypothetical protein